MENSYIIDVGGNLLDLRKVERVGELEGDVSWLNYTVYFVGGGKFSIYHNRKYSFDTTLVQMRREEFVELWKACVAQDCVAHTCVAHTCDAVDEESAIIEKVNLILGTFLSMDGFNEFWFKLGEDVQKEMRELMKRTYKR